MKYKYDFYSYLENGTGRTAGLGATSLVGQRKLYRNFVKKYPRRLQFIIRRPDNKLMEFNHPFCGIDLYAR